MMITQTSAFALTVGPASLAAGASCLTNGPSHRCLMHPRTCTSARSGRRPATAPPRMTVSTQGATPRLENPADILDRTNTFIFDCDGVIWLGDSLIDGSARTIERLRALGKRVFFVTNNSTKSRAGYLKKFIGLGLNARAEEIFSSSFAAAAYLEQTKFAATGKKVYVIGEVGICEELDLIGVPYIGGPEHSQLVPNMASGGRIDHDHDVGAVVVGFDRDINYYKMQYAQLCINENPGCKFIATNLDQVTHLTNAQEWAGNGAMVGAVKGCTGQEPILVGKPSPLMIDYITEKYSIARHEICMVGDRLDTDILFGKNNGLSSLLALSGVTKLSVLQSPENTIRPDYFVDRIADLVR
jgi:phosphoglycolate/pyridoxal phosphate phosphatase family enzyme